MGKVYSSEGCADAMVADGYAAEEANHISNSVIEQQREQIERLTAALVEIRDHWACQYDHPRKESEMYRGSYGIGVTDGHRACRIIAERALEHGSDQAT